ncbi:MAG: hypothetical protein KGK01_14820 [Bradyrhizobium sp.]|uniref:hypothetical protein n=1 Tax=Bradyrhizobium sp. TaxID=376 RepID=UPI001C29D8BE|nr:hypothetical protein [Bradyrhizobium sp.]MBU6461195.1 hypothetical protein [Pseudomonadota bacterium]MDE2066271.1 hypothetical protein [Bradyrhizobium sp.]MDE2243649.1 hypothetical protein [Bradyrhizobium sp.]MDE2468222.1 hypothetical protein [Bradyrhizobium sp.]
MESEKAAGILGVIVAIAVLAAAFYFVPPGSNGKSAKSAAQPQQTPEAPAAAAPAPRGPVIREVPQQ